MMVQVLGQEIEGHDAAYALGQSWARRHPRRSFEQAEQAARSAYLRATPAERGFNKPTFLVVFLAGWLAQEATQ